MKLSKVGSEWALCQIVLFRNIRIMKKDFGSSFLLFNLFIFKGGKVPRILFIEYPVHLVG